MLKFLLANCRQSHKRCSELLELNQIISLDILDE